MSIVPKQRVTMADVARASGVSVPTVSYVLNGRAQERHLSTATVARVFQAVEDLGYVRNGLASNLRRATTKTVGFLCSDLERSWAQRVLTGMLQVFDVGGYTVTISVHLWDPERERREIQMFLENQHAAIVTRPMVENLESYRQVIARGVALVLLDPLEELPKVSTVHWNYSDAIRAVVARLVAQGRRRIAFVGVDRGTGETALKVAAFKAALMEQGVAFEPEMLCLDRRYALKEDEQNEHRVVGYGSALKGIFQQGNWRPDALLAGSDALACMCLTMVREDFGLRVPEDVAIVGLGDHGESPFIGLSTAREPLEAIGFHAASMALGQVRREGRTPGRVLVDSTELHWRGTTP